jgi:hypothetical protein
MSKEKSPFQIWKENSSVKPWDLVNPKEPRATEELSADRYNICTGCEFFIKLTTQCKKCGCFMNLKTKLERATCPVGKW